MFDEKFHAEVTSCPASMTVSTRYADGGVDIEHGMLEGSAECACGHRRHYVGDGGRYYPSLRECNDTLPEDVTYV
jgi:hypothetical protein